jgi:cystathionine beta-lyase/cystathionine gamma-synthase
MENLNNILIHLGEEREKYFNAISPPIIQSSNFAFKKLDDFRNAFLDEMESHLYTRGNNPTVGILRKKVAALENAEDALVFGSGSAAIAAAIMANAKSGDHVVCVQSPYAWTYKILTEYLSRFGVTHTFVDGTNIEEIEKAIQKNTTLLFLESPNSITFELQDLTACATLAKKHGIVTAIDNSYCSPIFQKPMDYGIDIVVHSGTKYLNGHSDVVVGVLCSNKKMIKKIFDAEYMTLGGILSPNDAFLMIRGLRTLELRLKRSDESAGKITRWLENHPKIEKLIYPFSKNFPQYQLAQQQMRGAGGLFSVLLKTDKMENVENFFHKLERFLFAVSWGGHESLVLPFCAFYNIPGREDSTHPWNLVRFYIGLEDPDWLMEDLEQALLEL